MKNFGYLIKEGFKNIISNKLMAIASIGTLICCMLLTGAAALVVLNIQAVITETGQTNVVNVYLEDDLTQSQQDAIENELNLISNVQSSSFYSKEEAILEFKEQLGPAFEQYNSENNPLPDTFQVYLTDFTLYDDTIKEIKAIEGVDETNDRSDLASELQSINRFVITGGIVAIVVLGFISILIISNSIRMAMITRSLEISIMKFVGATNTFIKIPFLTEGIIIGLLAGGISSVATYYLYDLIVEATTSIIQIETLSYDTLWLPITVGFISVGLIIGVASGTISIKRYLKKENKNFLTF